MQKNAEETKLAREEERRLKHADRPVLANEGGTNHALGQEDLDAEFERLTMFDPSEHEAEMKRWKKGTKPPLGTKKLQTYAEDLELRSYVYSPSVPYLCPSQLTLNPDPSASSRLSPSESTPWRSTLAGPEIS